MEQKQKSEETETSHPEIDNSKLIEDAKEMMASLQIVNIEKTITESMAKHMQEWQRSIMTTFATTCSSLIETAVKKTDKKIERIEDTTIEHEHRITALETMADEFDQQKRSNNIVVRGLKQHTDPKTSAIEMITSALGIHVTENDIKYAVKITLKNEKKSTDSMKIAFFETRLRDEVYARRTKLKGTEIYISEDLTLKKSNLPYEARQYTREHPNSTTWTSEGSIFIKDAINDKPRLVRCIADLESDN